ncbi:MAG: hypothetical protein V3S33_01595, partial [Gammaproteobacteria bacterium]
FNEPTYWQSVITRTEKYPVYAYFEPWWIMPIARMLSVVFMLAGALFFAAALRNTSIWERSALAIAILSVPYYVGSATYVQIEPYSIGLLGLLIFLFSCKPSVRRDLAMVPVFVALVGLKWLHLANGLILVAAALQSRKETQYRISFARDRIAWALLLGYITIGGLILWYLPFRNPAELWQQVLRSSAYYEGKSSTENLLQIYIHDTHLMWWHLVLIAGGINVWLTRSRLNDWVVAAPTFVILGYFLSVNWHVDRNVYVVPAVFLYLAFVGLSRYSSDYRGVRLVVWSAVVILSVHSVMESYRQSQPVADFHVTISEELLRRPCGRIILEPRVQIHPKSLDGKHILVSELSDNNVGEDTCYVTTKQSPDLGEPVIVYPGTHQVPPQSFWAYPEQPYSLYVYELGSQEY